MKFRFTFESDSDDLQEMGYYIDDFVIYGNDNFTIPNRVGLTEVTYPTCKINSLDVPILCKDSTASFSTTVTNYGKSQAIDVRVIIEDLADKQNEVYNQSKRLLSLQGTSVFKVT